jgi:hypothetical protein
MKRTVDHLPQPSAAGARKAVFEGLSSVGLKIADYPDFFEFSGAYA